MVEERADASEETASELFVIARPSRAHLALMWFQPAQYAARSDLAFSVPLGDGSSGLGIEVPSTLQKILLLAMSLSLFQFSICGWGSASSKERGLRTKSSHGLPGLWPVASSTRKAPSQWLRSEQMQARRVLRNCL